MKLNIEIENIYKYLENDVLHRELSTDEKTAAEETFIFIKAKIRNAAS